MPDTIAIVPAAGSGERLGAGVPKAFVELGGRTLLEWAVDGLLGSGVIDRVVVAVPVDRVASTAALLGDRALVVAGGAERHESVRLALDAVGEPDYVVIHDAARPLTPVGQIRRVVGALLDGAGAVIPVLPVADTIKAVDSDGAVLGTPQRSGLRAAQTPQGFAVELLRRAHRQAGGLAVTDDSALVENLGAPVRTVPGDPLAFKVTTPLDLRLARAVLDL